MSRAVPAMDGMGRGAALAYDCSVSWAWTTQKSVVAKVGGLQDTPRVWTVGCRSEGALTRLRRMGSLVGRKVTDESGDSAMGDRIDLFYR